MKLKMAFLIALLICTSRLFAAASPSNTTSGNNVYPLLPPTSGTIMPPSKYYASAAFVGNTNNSGSGGIAGSSGNQTTQSYLYQQSKCGGNSGTKIYWLNNGTYYLTVPHNGNYTVSYFVNTFNNNSGSVEWNNMIFSATYLPPNGVATTVPGSTMTPGQNGGSCNSGCSKWNVGYVWWTTTPVVSFTGGTQIWVSGAVSDTGDSSCGDVLVTGGGLTLSEK